MARHGRQASFCCSCHLFAHAGAVWDSPATKQFTKQLSWCPPVTSQIPCTTQVPPGKSARRQRRKQQKAKVAPQNQHIETRQAAAIRRNKWFFFQKLLGCLALLGHHTQKASFPKSKKPRNTKKSSPETKVLSGRAEIFGHQFIFLVHLRRVPYSPFIRKGFMMLS